MWSTLTSSSMLIPSCELGNLDNTSANKFVAPLWWEMSKLYPYNAIIIRCNLAGTFLIDLSNIITSGLWSVTTWNLLPYKYWWNLCVANTIINSSRSIHAYRCSVLVRLLLVYATGRRSPLSLGCSYAAPTPFWLASQCRYTGLLTSKYCNADAWEISFLMDVNNCS